MYSGYLNKATSTRRERGGVDSLTESNIRYTYIYLSFSRDKRNERFLSLLQQSSINLLFIYVSSWYYVIHTSNDHDRTVSNYHYKIFWALES